MILSVPDCLDVLFLSIHTFLDDDMVVKATKSDLGNVFHFWKLLDSYTILVVSCAAILII